MFRFLFDHPFYTSALMTAMGLVTWVTINALYWQNNPHNAPMFSSRSQGGFLHFLAPQDINNIIQQHTNNYSAPLVAGRAMISEVQSLLAIKGFYHGIVDGVDGLTTRAAIAEYERSLGLEPTGEPSEGLLARMRLNDKIENNIPLPMRKQSENPKPAIRPENQETMRLYAIQRALNQFGYGPVQVDGIMGENTRQAIRRFQINQELEPSGKLDDDLVMRLIAIGALD